MINKVIDSLSPFDYWKSSSNQWQDKAISITHQNDKLQKRIEKLETAANNVCKILDVNILRDHNPNHPYVLLHDILKENKK